MLKNGILSFPCLLLAELVYIKQTQKMSEFSHQLQTSTWYSIVILELENTKGESESARCHSCSRVDFCSLARINTAENLPTYSTISTSSISPRSLPNSTSMLQSEYLPRSDLGYLKWRLCIDDVTYYLP